MNVGIGDASSGRVARVSKHHAVCVSPELPDLPPAGTRNRITFLNQLMVDSNGSSVMRVDGSSDPVTFSLAAESDVDLRVSRIIILIADSAVKHNLFGNVAALANGFDLESVESGVVVPLISSAKTGGEVIVQSGMFSPYGTGADSFEITNWQATGDAQVVSMDIASLVPGGIRIPRGSTDRLVARVNDDLTGLSEFSVRVFGYRHHE